jgi:hypothetical protein
VAVGNSIVEHPQAAARHAVVVRTS